MRRQDNPEMEMFCGGKEEIRAIMMVFRRSEIICRRSFDYKLQFTTREHRRRVKRWRHL